MRGIYLPFHIALSVLDTPRSLIELVEITGLPRDSMAKLLTELMSESEEPLRKRMVRIGAWKKDARGHRWIRLYVLGSEPDAPKPKNLPAATVKKRSRERMQKLRKLRNEADRPVPCQLF